MLSSTLAVVLHTLKYTETSLILHAYTEAFGIQSYLIKGVRKNGSRIGQAHFQPLTLLELVVYHKENRSLQPIKELRMAEPCYSLQTDIRKSSIALFIAELVYRSVKEEEPNAELFSFLWHSVLLLDATDRGLAVFHLLFGIRLSRFLGFFPASHPDAINRYFHLREGIYLSQMDSPDLSLDDTLSAWWAKLVDTRLEEGSRLTIPIPVRNLLLEKLLRFYYLHLPGMKPLRSPDILHRVLS